MTYDIHVQLRSSELASAIKQLAEAIAGHPLPALDKPIESTHPVEQTVSTPEATSDIAFDDVHKALVDLKGRKGAAAVREILSAFDCKTVQDIPKERFAEALRLAQEG